MTSPADITGGMNVDDDVLLTAWLDGELPADERARVDRRLAAEPALAARLEHLRGGVRPLAAACDALLDAAPTDRLNGSLAAALARRQDAHPAPRVMSRWWLAAAAAIVLFAVGATAGYVAHMLTPPPYKGWRQVVAEYHALISPETLAVMREDPAALTAELSAVGERLSLDLTPERLALPDADLRRVQLYDYSGRPLAQFVYLSAASGPVALCIIANGREDEPPEYEEREGSRIVYWSNGGLGYLLIAKDATREELEQYASDVARQVS